MTILLANSKKKNPITKREDDSPLSNNNSKAIKYRKRVQEELEANEEIRIYKNVNEDYDSDDHTKSLAKVPM